MAVAICTPPLKMRYPVTPTLSVEAVQDKLIWEDDAAEAERLVGTEGGVVSVDGGSELFTVTEIAEEVAVFPAASRARAVRVCEPLDVWVVSQTMEYGAVVSSEPRFTPSKRNCTPKTPTLSEAVAEMLTEEPDTVAPFAGDEIETVGGVVSGGAWVVPLTMDE